MVILRATRKLETRLSGSGTTPGLSDTALGDWYANRLVVDRQPLLLLVSSVSLLSVVSLARDVRGLPARLPGMVGRRLCDMGLAVSVIEAELAAMDPVHVGQTTDRSVLGSMVDFAKAIVAYLPHGTWGEPDLPRVEELLAQTPCRVTRRSEDTLYPDRKTREVLAARWRSA
jgi:hypothetical protein